MALEFGRERSRPAICYTVLIEIPLSSHPCADRGAAEGEVRQGARGAAEEAPGQEDAAIQVRNGAK